MSNEWSSFQKDKLIMEAWRRHLKEDLDEGLWSQLTGKGSGKEGGLADLERQDKEEAEAECPPGCCPCDEEEQQPKQEYPATGFTDLYKTLDDVNLRVQAVDRDDLNKELQQLFKDQNFVIKERAIHTEAQGEIHGGALSFERPPQFNLKKYPNLMKLFQAAGEDPKLAQALQKAFVGAGFKNVTSTSEEDFFGDDNLDDDKEADKEADKEGDDVALPCPEGEVEDKSGECVVAPAKEKEAEKDAAGKSDIYVFRGKGGKGLQSQFAKVGIQGKAMGALLKGLRADLTDAGFNVLQEASREIIALTNTLAALEQIQDAAQKEAAKKILVLLLRTNKIKLDPQSSRALAPGGAGPEQQPQQDDVQLPCPEDEVEDPKSGECASTFMYASSGGKESAVKIVNPTPNPSKPDLIAVQKIDPNNCQPVPGGEFAATKSNLKGPYDKCEAGPQGEPEKEEEESLFQAMKRRKDPSARSPVPESLRKEDEVLLERWQKLAGIIKG